MRSNGDQDATGERQTDQHKPGLIFPRYNGHQEKIVYSAVGGVPDDQKEGEEFPFANHQENYQVDLDAIPLGAKIASMIVLDVLIK